MRIDLTKHVHFSASHRLHDPALSDERNRELYGICNHPNGHGHNYELEVTLRGEPDPESGMIMDLKEIKEIVEREILDHVDHKHLNLDVPFLVGINPTAENLAIAFFRILEAALSNRLRGARIPPAAALHRIRLYETRTNWVDCYGSE